MESQKEKYKIILADDHAMFRAGLKKLIDDIPLFSVVAEAGDGQEVLDKLDSCKCDLVILDISMPKISGIRCIEKIKEKNPAQKILILSMHSEAVFIRQAASKGVNGYILKDDVFEKLIIAIKEVRQGNVYFSPKLVPLIVQHYILASENPMTIADLSKREMEILKLIGKSFSTRAISKELDISMRTVETHKYRMMKKLNIDKTADLIKLAIYKDLV